MHNHYFAKSIKLPFSEKFRLCGPFLHENIQCIIFIFILSVLWNGEIVIHLLHTVSAVKWWTCGSFVYHKSRSLVCLLQLNLENSLCFYSVQITKSQNLHSKPLHFERKLITSFISWTSFWFMEYHGGIEWKLLSCFLFALGFKNIAINDFSEYHFLQASSLLLQHCLKCSFFFQNLKGARSSNSRLAWVLDSRAISIIFSALLISLEKRIVRVTPAHNHVFDLII